MDQKTDAIDGLATSGWKFGHFWLEVWPLLAGSLATSGWKFGHVWPKVWPLMAGSLATSGWKFDHFWLKVWPLLAGSFSCFAPRTSKFATTRSVCWYKLINILLLP
jgi:hypothetical protein